jgi:hypothetical protein
MDHEYDARAVENKDEDEHQKSLSNVLEGLRGHDTNLILGNAPRNLKECYFLRAKKMIPNMMLMLSDSEENMVKFYVEKEGKSNEEAK